MGIALSTSLNAMTVQKDIVISDWTYSNINDEKYIAQINDDNLKEKGDIDLENFEILNTEETENQDINAINIDESLDATFEVVMLEDTTYGVSTKEARATSPLELAYLTYASAYPFTAGGDASFQFRVNNTSSSTVYDVTVNFYLDGEYISSGSIGNLNSGYGATGEFTLSGVEAGYHQLTIQAQTTSSNYGVRGTATFLWEGTPDLIAEIYRTDSNSDEVYANEDLKYHFSVSNIGNDVAGPFTIQLIRENGNSDDTQVLELDVDSLEAGVTAGANIIVNYGLGSEGKVKVIVDSNNDVTEAAEGNNTASCTCKVKYILYSLGDYVSNWVHNKDFGGVGYTNPSVEYDKAVANHYSTGTISSAVQAWNGISSNLKVKSPQKTSYVTNNKGSYDIRIRMAEEGELGENVLADTNPQGERVNNSMTYEFATIRLGSNIPDIYRTLTHEMGHALGLDHPYDVDAGVDFDSYEHGPYPSIMWQTAYTNAGYATTELTNADRYQIKELYDNK